MNKNQINATSFFLYIFVLMLPVLCMAQVTDMTVFQSNMRNKATSQFYQEEFKRIGAYKVKGNSNLLNGNNVTDLYTTLGFGTNMPVVYDTYTQELSILQENKKDMVKLTFDEIDSFIVKVDNDLNYKQPAIFINAYKIDASKKMYLQKLTNGSKFNLYKSYYAEMRPAAMDVAQTNVREFEIVSEYFFLDMSSRHSFIKIKPNTKSLKEQFKDYPAAIDVLNKNASLKLENKLIIFFDKINE